VLPQVSKLTGAALNFFFPQKCLGCGDEGFLICPACRRSLKRILPPVCPRCGRPQINGINCPSCVNWPCSVDCIRAPLQFEGLTRQAVHQFKYKNLRSLAGTLANILYEFLQPNPLPAQVLVPVPLHPRRLKERGYNQSALLAVELSKLSRVPVNEACLIRANYTGPQAKTAAVTQRRENVRTAFTCRDSSVTGKQILLIDDVATSGATLDACARELKSAGAASVCGLAVAREL
jgi:ComF family protein